MNFKISFNTAVKRKEKEGEAKDITQRETNKHFFFLLQSRAIVGWVVQTDPNLCPSENKLTESLHFDL